MKNQKGFSLIELLVVVIIIGIIAAIAIPSLLSSRKAARESAAAATLRSLSAAQATYQATSGGGTTYAPDLATLGTSKLIDSGLAGGSKNGYGYAMTMVTGNAGYCVLATPTAGAADKNFAMDDDGAIYYDSASPTAMACTAGAQSGGTALGN